MLQLFISSCWNPFLVALTQFLWCMRHTWDFSNWLMHSRILTHSFFSILYLGGMWNISNDVWLKMIMWTWLGDSCVPFSGFMFPLNLNIMSLLFNNNSEDGNFCQKTSNILVLSYPSISHAHLVRLKFCVKYFSLVCPHYSWIDFYLLTSMTLVLPFIYVSADRTSALEEQSAG